MRPAHGAPSGSLPARLLRAKPVIWTLLVLPGLWPAWPWFVRPDTAAQADPLKFILHHLGLVILLVVVAEQVQHAVHQQDADLIQQRVPASGKAAGSTSSRCCFTPQAATIVRC